MMLLQRRVQYYEYHWRLFKKSSGMPPEELRSRFLKPKESPLY